jgi:peptide chain release factor 2
LQRRSILEKKIERQERFESQIADAGVLFEFAEEDEDSIKELRPLVERLEHEIGVAETEMLLGGGNDQLNAICTIHPGAGGTESQDWAEMLLRMYLKWAEQREFKTEILDYQPGEEAGLKGVTFRVEGECCRPRPASTGWFAFLPLIKLHEDTLLSPPCLSIPRSTKTLR